MQRRGFFATVALAVVPWFMALRSRASVAADRKIERVGCELVFVDGVLSAKVSALRPLSQEATTPEIRRCLHNAVEVIRNARNRARLTADQAAATNQTISVLCDLIGSLYRE